MLGLLLLPEYLREDLLLLDLTWGCVFGKFGSGYTKFCTNFIMLNELLLFSYAISCNLLVVTEIIHFKPILPLHFLLSLPIIVLKLLPYHLLLDYIILQLFILVLHYCLVRAMVIFIKILQYKCNFLNFINWLGVRCSI